MRGVLSGSARPSAGCARRGAGPGRRGSAKTSAQVRDPAAGSRGETRARPCAAGPRSRSPATTTRAAPCRSRWRPPVRDGRRRERWPRPRSRAAAPPASAAAGEPSRFAGRQRPAAPFGDGPGPRCSACSLTGMQAGAAAHQPRSSGSDSAASCQAATAARASRSGSPSMPTGLERATIARSVFRPATREFGSWSRGSTSKLGLPGEVDAPGSAPPLGPRRRRPGLEHAQHALGPEVLMEVDGVHERDHSLFCIKLVDIVGFRLESRVRHGPWMPNSSHGKRCRGSLASAALVAAGDASAGRKVDAQGRRGPDGRGSARFRAGKPGPVSARRSLTRPERPFPRYLILRGDARLHRKEVLDLGGRNLPDSPGARRFAKYYDRSPLGPPLLLLARENASGRLVGMASLLPIDAPGGRPARARGHQRGLRHRERPPRPGSRAAPAGAGRRSRPSPTRAWPAPTAARTRSPSRS